jgi:transposase
MERDEWLRAAWTVTVAGEAGTDARRLVFVDEMGSNIALAPLYAWAPKGKRAFCSTPRNRGKNTTLLSSISLEGMGPSLVVEGSTNKVLFETYIERVLCPHLKDGQVVVMDNLSAHKGDRVRELIEGRGCELVYLPAYSPDFSPIEEAFSKIKGILRKLGARSREALIEALGVAISVVSIQDALGFFKHCGYGILAQPL